MRMSETVFMVTTQICQNELLQSNKWSFPNDARQTEISYSKLSEEGYVKVCEARLSFLLRAG